MTPSNGWVARLKFYTSIGVLIGVVVASTFTIFETQAHHNRDVKMILENQERIIRRLDTLFFKESSDLAHPLHYSEPQLELLLDS